MRAHFRHFSKHFWVVDVQIVGTNADDGTWDD